MSSPSLVELPASTPLSPPGSPYNAVPVEEIPSFTLDRAPVPMANRPGFRGSRNGHSSFWNAPRQSASEEPRMGDYFKRRRDLLSILK